MLIPKSLKRSDMITCSLCENAPCTAACPHMDPAKMLRNIWFDNEDIAALALPPDNPCQSCDAQCEKACVRTQAVPVKQLMSRLYEEVLEKTEISIPKDEKRLECDLCGLPLENPFLLSSSVVA